MQLTDGISRWTVGVRSVVLAILVVGFFFQYPTRAIFLAALAFASAEALRLRSVARRRRGSFLDLASSQRVLRRGRLWALIAVAVLFDLLITQSVLLAFASATLVYAGGLFAQSARARAG